MTTAQWERAKSVTADALERTAEARAGFVAEACSDDGDVCREVWRLLGEVVDSGQDFLSSPPLRLPSLLAYTADLKPTFSAGQIVASRFRVERFLNRGGMGEVYEALDLELQEPV